MDNIPGFWFSPTYDCNNRCAWCYAGRLLSSRYHAPLDQAQTYVRQLKQAGARSCILVGGEPTKYPHLLELVSFMSRIGLEVKIMSNGRALADSNFVTDLKKAGLHYCAVSIEGTEAIHDAITQVPGSFAESWQGLENLKSAGIRCNTITTVSSYNINIIDELVEFFQGRVPMATFNMCSAQPSGFHKDEHAGQITLAQYARVVERIGTAYDFTRFYALLPLCLYDQALLPGLLESGRLRVSCSLHGNAVAVDPWGNLSPCTHMPDLQYGQLDDPGALPRFLSARIDETRFLKTHAPSQHCVNCRLWTTCLGGCNLIWFARNAQENIPGLAPQT